MTKAVKIVHNIAVGDHLWLNGRRVKIGAIDESAWSVRFDGAEGSGFQRWVPLFECLKLSGIENNVTVEFVEETTQ